MGMTRIAFLPPAGNIYLYIAKAFETAPQQTIPGPGGAAWQKNRNMAMKASLR